MSTNLQILHDSIVDAHRGQAPLEVAETFYRQECFGLPRDPSRHPLTRAIIQGELYALVDFSLQLSLTFEDEEHAFSQFMLLSGEGEPPEEIEIKGPLRRFIERFDQGHYPFLLDNRSGRRARRWRRFKERLRDRYDRWVGWYPITGGRLE